MAEWFLKCRAKHVQINEYFADFRAIFGTVVATGGSRVGFLYLS